jgi:HNH endonuclease
VTDTTLPAPLVPAEVRVGSVLSFATARVAPEKRTHRPPAVAPISGGQGEDMATKLSYGEQLKHPNWQRRRLEMLSAAEFECQSCGDKEKMLHVHHRRYFKGRMAWEYTDDELQVLCKDCHAEQHDIEDLFKSVLAAGESMGYGQAVVLGLVAGYLDSELGLDKGLAGKAASITGPYFVVGQVASLFDRVGYGKLYAWGSEIETVLGLNPAQEQFVEFLREFSAEAGKS